MNATSDCGNTVSASVIEGLPVKIKNWNTPLANIATTSRVLQTYKFLLETEASWNTQQRGGC